MKKAMAGFHVQFLARPYIMGRSARRSAAVQKKLIVIPSMENVFATKVFSQEAQFFNFKLRGSHFFKGFTGDLCDATCPPYTYGEGCGEKCRCQNGAKCNHVSGECYCPPSYYGPLCEFKCTNDKSDECKSVCRCQNEGFCDEDTALCKCPPGWTGDVCANRCQPGRYGNYDFLPNIVQFLSRTLGTPFTQFCNIQLPIHFFTGYFQEQDVFKPVNVLMAQHATMSPVRVLVSCFYDLLDRRFHYRFLCL